MTPDTDLEDIVDELADIELRKSLGDYAEQDVDSVIHARMDEIVRNSLMPEPPDVVEVGVDWGDIGRGVMGGLHTAGGIVLNVFGAGEVAKKLEVAEAKAGLLPDWARTDASAGIPSAEASSAPAAPGASEPSVFSKSAAPIRLPGYAQAEMRTRAAQKQLEAIKAQPKREYTPIPVNIPAFSFEGKSMSQDVVGEHIVEELAKAGDPLACEVTGEYNVSSDIYLLGSDVLVGVTPQPLGGKKPGALKPLGGLKKKPTGLKKPSAFKKLSLGKSPHKLALGRALRRADRLDAVATTAKARASQYKPGKTIVPLKPVAVRGDDIILGAAPLTSKQKAAIEKHQRAIEAHGAAVRKAVVAADKAKKVAGELRGKVAKYKPIIDKLLTSKGPMVVLGDDPFEPHYEMLGLDYVECMGEDDGTEVADDMDIPLPKRGQPMTINEAFDANFAKLPDSAIVPDPSLTFPADNLLGSASVWFKAVPEGYPQADGGAGSGFVTHNDGLYFLREGKFFKANDAERASWAAAQRASIGHSWGPIIGNPNGALPFILYATEDKKFFWLPDNAPKWATKDQDQAIVDLNNKNREARRAEEAVRKAQAEKEAAEAAEALAKQEAANALAESAANSQEKIAQQANAAKQAELELAQQKAEQELAVQYAQQELAERRAQLEAGILPGYEDAEQYGAEEGGFEGEGEGGFEGEGEAPAEEMQAPPQESPEE